MASRSLGSLTVDLILRTGGFKQGADQAAREAARFEKRIESSFRGVSAAAAKLAGVFGVALGAEALRRTAAAAIEFGDEVQKAVAKTGIAAEAFSELAYAAKQNDVELSGLTTALKKMQTTLSEAGSGSKSATETLTALGLTLSLIHI